MALWVGLWKMPQALMWERFGQQIEVALYVRRLAESERPRSAVILGTLVRQMMDSLGLTVPGLRMNRWKIAAERPAVVSTADGAARPSSRSRFTVVRDDGAA